MLSLKFDGRFMYDVYLIRVRKNLWRKKFFVFRKFFVLKIGCSDCC